MPLRADVAEFLEHPVVAGPVGLDLDPELELVGFAVDGGELFLGGVADVADHLGALADDDGALGGLFDVDGGLDGDGVVGFLDLVDGDGDGVGQFGLEADIDLAADDVGDEERARIVGEHIGREKRLVGGGHLFADGVEEFGQAGAGGGGNLEPADGRRGEGGIARAVFLEDFGPDGFVGGPAAAEIGLVEEGEDGRGVGGEFLHPAAVLVLRGDGAVEQEQDDVGAGDEAARGAVEHRAEGMRGLADAGGVEEDDLEVGFVVDAADGAARGLGDGRDDGDLFAEEGVEERGLAGVGAADDGGDAGAERRGGRDVGHGAEPRKEERSTTSPLAGRATSACSCSWRRRAKDSRWDCSPWTRKTFLGLASRT